MILSTAGKQTYSITTTITSRKIVWDTIAYPYPKFMLMTKFFLIYIYIYKLMILSTATMAVIY